MVLIYDERRYGMSKRKDSVNLNVYVATGIMSQLEEYCRLTGRTKTVVAERALREYLDAHGSEARAEGWGATDGKED